MALGGLKNARLLEPAAVLWIHLAMVQKLGRRMALRLEGEGARAAPIAISSPSRKVAVLGAGNIGAGLVRAWARAGHGVTLGVRTVDDPDVQALAKETGARVTSVHDAVAASDVVAIAIPAQAVDSLSTLSFAGKTVIDCTNHVGPGFALSFGHSTSGAEEVAKKLPGAREGHEDAVAYETLREARRVRAPGRERGHVRRRAQKDHEPRAREGEAENDERHRHGDAERHPRSRAQRRRRRREPARRA